jgi:hypothetical protein
MLGEINFVLRKFSNLPVVVREIGLSSGPGISGRTTKCWYETSAFLETKVQQ